MSRRLICSRRCEQPPIATWSPGNTSTDFQLVLDDVATSIIAGRDRGWTLTDAIIHTHLALIAQHGD